MESYVDDIFGGAATKERTNELKNQIIATGLVTTSVPNLTKCHGPSRRLTILGTMFDAHQKMVSLPPKKQVKYRDTLKLILNRGKATSKELERLVGYLVWASYTEPFGRPFISAISGKITRSNPKENVDIHGYIKWALCIWLAIIDRNRGISYDYVLNRLSRSENNWFGDASTSWGIGGCAGGFYFSVPNKDLTTIFSLYGACPDKENFEIPEKRLPIAYIELIAALVGFSVFSQRSPHTIISLFSDNTDVVA